MVSEKGKGGRRHRDLEKNAPSKRSIKDVRAIPASRSTVTASRRQRKEHVQDNKLHVVAL